MKLFLNIFIRRLKGESYTIDSRIPNSYLVYYSVGRLYMLWRGFTALIKKGDSLFIGNGVVIKGKSLVTVGSSVTFGDHCYVDALSREGIVLGNNVSVGKRTVIECTGNLQFIGKGLIVEDNVGLGTDCFYGCAGGVNIGMDTIIGNFVSFHSENHNFSDAIVPIRMQGVSHKGIIVGKNCWIGAKATVLDGATIEEGCIIAAGAVVTSGTYRRNGIYGGVPAKLIGSRPVNTFTIQNDLIIC